MTTTIDRQNALQIRERPMDIHVTLQTGESSRVGSYSASGQIKVDDDTLGEPAVAMRNVTDLAGDGFPLDGSCVWYDPTEQATATNGKMGLRSNIGQAVTVRVNSTNTITSLTIATRGEGTIEYNGTSYPATGLNVISIGATSAVLTFAPSEADERIEIDYIVPGIILEITNDNLISCNLALRSNLNVADHTWEESEIEIEMYYPYDISSSFAYVQNDWPITYQAGYDGDLSPERKFYLSEPIEMQDHLITIKGVDASRRLDEYSRTAEDFNFARSTAHQEVYQEFINRIWQSGINIEREQAWDYDPTGTIDGFVFTHDMTAREFVAGVMNLTMNHTRGDTHYGIQFVDAGIPTVEHGDGTVYGNIWTIRKSDCGDWQEVRERNIAKITSSDDEHGFNETLREGPIQTVYGPEAAIKNKCYDISYDGWHVYPGTNTGGYTLQWFRNGPEGAYVKMLETGGNSTVTFQAYNVLISGGSKAIANPNGLPGHEIEMEPFVYGIMTDSNGETVFNYPSLFKRSTHTISFTWKGDPRMQPLDYIKMIDDTKPASPATWYRITNIELTHEGGGTIATIEAREWERPLSIPDYYVLIDNNGNYIVTNNDEKLLATAEGD